MATKMNEKEREKLLEKTSIDQFINSDHYGFDVNVYNKHDKILNNLDNKVRKLIIDKQRKEDDLTSSMDKMFNMLKHSKNNSMIASLGNYKSAKEDQTHSGIRSLGELNTNPEELKLVDMYEQNIRNSFMQMNEFRIICKIVPELRKVVTNVTRDILNTNDINKHYIANLFKTNSDNGLSEEDVKRINEEIEEKIVLRHNLEDKIKQYINEALITGAKPIAVIPYRDISDMIYNKLKNSNESIDNYIDKILSSENYYLPRIKDLYQSSYNNSQENKKLNEDDEPLSEENLNIYDDILGNSVEALYNIELKSVLKDLHNKKNYTSMSKEDIEKLNEDIHSLEDESSDVVKVKKQEVKKEILKLVDLIDTNLEIVNPVNSAIKMAKASLKKGWKFKKLHENLMNIDVNADITRRSDTTILDTFKQNMNETDEDLETKKKPKDKNSKTKLNENEKDFLDDVLILDFEPENVIPVIVNGIHVDYYVLEEETYNGGFERNRKTSFSFMDIIKSLGVGNDDAITGQGAPGTDAMGYANLPTFGQQINVASITSSFTMTAQTDDAIKRNEILRDVVLRTIGTKIKDKDIIDNKVFRDCIMNLLRQGYILRKKVQFTNIPAGNMVYFAHNLSNTGLPKSIYADTLFYCYIYISSLISSLMIKLSKSSYKDKVTFEVARDGNFGLAAHLIDNGLSTRTTHGFNTFESVFSVLKNSVAHDRIIIPKIGGEQLIDYEQFEKMNDIDIDDEFTEKMLYKIVQQTDYPASSLNKLSEDEYSRSIVAQQIMYLNSLKEMQDTFGGQVTKLLKLCIKYTKFSETVEKDVKDNMKDLDFSFTIPNTLYLTNSTESFTNVESYADMITKIYFNEKMDDEAYKEVVDKFRLEVVKSKANNIDWLEYEAIYKQIMKEKPRLELEKKKNERRHEQMQEKALGEDAENEDMGGMDSGGFDSGDFGTGDDTGGMDFGSDTNEGNNEEPMEIEF